MGRHALLSAVIVTAVIGCDAGKHSGYGVRAAPDSAPSPSASPSASPSEIGLDPSLKVLHRESIELVSSLDHEDRVFALAADGKTLVAIDTRIGEQIWRSNLDLSSDERVSVYPDFGPKRRVAVHAGYEIVLVDREKGTVVARADTLRNYESTNNIVSTLEQAYGACVVYAACAMQPVDCEDGRRIGPQHRKSPLRIFGRDGGPHHTMCPGALNVVGRAASTVVVVTTEESPKAEASLMGEASSLLKGLDARSGATIWSRALPCEGCSRGPSGVSMDGATCWVSGDSQIEAFTCATGRAKFSRALTPASTAPEVFTAAVRRGIFLGDAANALVLDPKSGTPVWSKTLDAETLGLPLGTVLDLPAFSTWGARDVALLDPKDGREAARFALPAYTEMRQSADFGLSVADGPAYDGRGGKRYDRPPATFVAEGGRLVAPDGKVVVEGARSTSIVATRSSNAVDVVTFKAWSGDRLELFVTQRDR